MDKKALPKILQLRRGELARGGRTKHTHLVDVDTSDLSHPWAQATRDLQGQKLLKKAAGKQWYQRKYHKRICVQGEDFLSPAAVLSNPHHIPTCLGAGGRHAPVKTFALNYSYFCGLCRLRRCQGSTRIREAIFAKVKTRILDGGYIYFLFPRMSISVLRTIPIRESPAVGLGAAS